MTATITQVRALTPQQADVVEFSKTPKAGSAIVEAVAGSGKTYLLRAVVKVLKGSVAFCAFNKNIADEIGAKVAADKVEAQENGTAIIGQEVQCGTFHSFGFRAWRKVAPGVKVDDKKTQAAMDALQVPDNLQAFVRQLVSLAKQRAVGVVCNLSDRKAWLDIVTHFDLEEKLTNGASDALVTDDSVNEGINYAIWTLQRSIETAKKVIDFDDMIYMPVLENVKIWQHDWVLIDEAQDTNPARRALAKKMLRAGGRLIAVGDRHQAIYGFTGADSDSLDLIKREFGCVEFPLTVSFRCPRAVVAEARQYVSHITAADSAPEGSVTRIALDEFRKAAEAGQLQRDDAVLCRNTKPLVELAFSFIRAGLACHVEGRDIGAGLMALANRWKSVRTLDALTDKLDEYLAAQVERMLAKGQESRAEALTDRVETLKVIIDTVQATQEQATLAHLTGRINTLFGDTQPGQRPANLTLSTVHKSKGREWNQVYLFGANRYMPSPFARQDWQKAQETNLLYVAVTRAKQQLTHVSVPKV
jgi:superfamily I DNA/RNA helicase